MAKLIYDFYDGKDLYSDGDIENEILLDLKSGTDIAKKIDCETRWAYQYHMNPERQNILSVCNVLKDDYVLEIGAGCGAISSGLLKFTDHLDAVELSERRSKINFERNKEKPEFNIFIGNFDKVVLPRKYDKIFLIGVLEYAKLYFPDEENPFIHLLEKARGLLKENGKLFIAIENKYGMKYFSGAPEDHSGVLFEGIEGYSSKGATTFSKNELSVLLKQAGLNNIFFYYPLPDYKFPEEIYSEKYLPTSKEFNYLGHSYDRERYIIFKENAALKEAARCNDFETFANSFLVKAGE